MGFFTSNNHRRWRQNLSAYLDRRLSPEAQHALEAHLATCEGCRKELAALQATVSLLRALPQAAAPRSFALRQAPVARPWWLRYDAPLRLAAAATAMLLVTVIAGDLLTTPAGTAPSPFAAPRGPAVYSTATQTAGGGASAVTNAAAPVQQDTGLTASPTPAPTTSPVAAKALTASGAYGAPGLAFTANQAASSTPELATSSAPLPVAPQPEQGDWAAVTATDMSSQNTAQPASQAAVPQKPAVETAGAPNSRLWRWGEGLLASLLVMLLTLTLLQWRSARSLGKSRW